MIPLGIRQITSLEGKTLQELVKQMVSKTKIPRLISWRVASPSSTELSESEDTTELRRSVFCGLGTTSNSQNRQAYILDLERDGGVSHSSASQGC